MTKQEIKELALKVAKSIKEENAEEYQRLLPLWKNSEMSRSEILDFRDIVKANA